MFDVGGPEFLVICIVALVVLGPERLPEVMRTVGRAYRRARRLLDEYTSEAQRLFDEGLREVNDVGTTVSAGWPEALSGAPGQPVAEVVPGPPLLQVPAAASPARTAPAAGPWVLPAAHLDPSGDPDTAAHALPSGRPSSPVALDPGRLDASLPETDDVMSGGDDRLWAPTGPEGPPRMPEPAAVASGTAWGAAGSAPPGPPPSVRQETLVTLYRRGDVTLETATRFLDMTPEAFRALLSRTPLGMVTLTEEQLKSVGR